MRLIPLWQTHKHTHTHTERDSRTWHIKFPTLEVSISRKPIKEAAASYITYA